jgi:hypothetical protein
MAAIAAIMVAILAAITEIISSITASLRNFMHFGGHLKNGCQNDRHFEISLVTTTFL